MRQRKYIYRLVEMGTRPAAGVTATHLQQEEPVAVDAVLRPFHLRHRGLPSNRHEDVIGCVVHSVHLHRLRPDEGTILDRHEHATE